MFKKTLISLAVASSVGLTGCFDSAGSGSSNADPDYKISNPDFTGRTWPVFKPLTSELPVPSDLQFAQGAGADGTLNGSAENPITNALDFMDGSSTTAQFDIKLSASIDPDTLNFTPVIEGEGGAPAPNPQQNVFLLSLDFPGGDSLLNNGSHYTKLINELVDDGAIPAPERTSFPGETPTFDLGLAFLAAQQNPSPETAGAVFDFNNEFRAEVVSLDGGTDNVLRITPLRPLDPKKKYLVVVTNEIKDNTGDPIVGSPSYQDLGDPNQPIGNSALAPVRGAILGWESLATGYFNALTNNSREAVGLPPLTADNLALTLTFTTGGTEDVLEAATSPAQFFYKNSVVSTRQQAIAEYLAANADAFENWTLHNSMAPWRKWLVKLRPRQKALLRHSKSGLLEQKQALLWKQTSAIRNLALSELTLLRLPACPRPHLDCQKPGPFSRPVWRFRITWKSQRTRTLAT